MRPTIDDFTDDDLDEAALVCAAAHEAHRALVPALDPAYEIPAVAHDAIEKLRGDAPVVGASARVAGRLVGYLVGTRRDDSIWGPNVWIEAAGSAAAEAETIRDLYAHAAEAWVESGLTAHYAVVRASATDHVDAWFRLGFGQQHVQALREPPAEGELAPLRAGITIRRARHSDLDALARLELVLPEHQALAPTFSRLAVPTVESARREWEEDWDDPRFTTFVAEHDGRVIGSAVGCSIEVSSMHAGITRPPGAAFLGFAAVLPEARGHGVGRALGEAVLAWARDVQAPVVVTDWRATNLLSSRTWPRLGFRPTFLRLHRAVLA